MLAGCGGSRPPIGAPGGDANLTHIHSRISPDKKAPQYVYVSNEVKSGSGWASSVNIYSAFLSGNITPSVVISGSQTQLTEVNGIAVDSTGEIYVVNTDTDEIVGFAPGSSGNVAPNIVIGGSQTGMSRPTGLALDASDNLYVGNCASGCGVGSQPPAILEFSTGSNGNVAPVRDISGSYTQLASANAPALDSSSNIYISNWTANTIEVFAPSANGNTPPTRVLSGSKTLLEEPDGITVDSDGLYAGSATANYVERFHVKANGNIPPVSVVSGGRTHLKFVDGIAVDSRGVVYATSVNFQGILKFAALADGNIRPIGRIQGSKTELVSPVFVFVK
jgi:hypothetical protein